MSAPSDVHSCDHCGKTNANAQCSRCKSAYYCGRECQSASWKEHKKICNKSPQAFSYTDKINEIHDIITTDAGGRGMKHLVVEGDLLASAETLARLRNTEYSPRSRPEVAILTGFPCCVDHTPPMETDGLASVAIAHACIRLGYNATIISEKCNESVLRAAVEGVVTEEFYPNPMMRDVPFPIDTHARISFYFVQSPTLSAEDERKLLGYDLKQKTDLIIACERAGPSADGNCYTMSGINMNEKGLIAPLHTIVSDFRDIGQKDKRKFIAIGDGGNELGMGKVKDKVYEHIRDGGKIGAVDKLDGKNLTADYLIAASVSNWGAYALIAATALVRAHDAKDRQWIKRVLPTEESETALLHRCVAAGCRDGVSGEKEATVDGMPLERSMECLRDIRKIALGKLGGRKE